MFYKISYESTGYICLYLCVSSYLTLSSKSLGYSLNRAFFVDKGTFQS